MSSDIRRRPEGAILRTYLSAAGVAPESLTKPMIGVVTASTQVFSEKPDARTLGEAAAQGIQDEGGMAVRWDTVRSPEYLAWGHAEGYSFAWRDQLADLIESWTRQEALDGLVLIGDAPETLAGMAMAAARLNVSAVLVVVGSNRWEYSSETNGNGRKKGFADPFALLTETLFAKKKNGADHSIASFEKCLLTQDNHASNAVGLVLEAMGVCLPGCSTAPAASPKLQELAKASGSRVMALAKMGHGFRRFLTMNGFSNGLRLNAALGGSVDVAVHLMAIAHEAGVPLRWDAIDRISQETPQLCFLGGVGGRAPHRIEDLDRAGGVWAILHGFKSLIQPTITVNGRGAMELAKSTGVKDAHVIATGRPIRKKSGIGVLRGNLAPDGAVFLLNQVLPELAQVRGPVAVFDKEIDAAKAVADGEVKKGSILVVRNQGPKGGPGLLKLRILPALLESRGLNKAVPLITDGRLPDSPAGLFISLASPEGAVLSPIGILRTGDVVDIDLDQRRLSLRLTDTDIRLRYARWQAPVVKTQRDFLARYSRSVSPVHEGAVLK